MKKYLINISDKSLTSAFKKAIGEENLATEEDAKPTIIDDLTYNSYIANIFNRSNGILVLGSYGKSSVLSMLTSIFKQNNENPTIINLGKNKEIAIAEGGFCLLNPGMNMDLIRLLKPSIVILTGIINTKKSIAEQSHTYEIAIKQTSVGMILNFDCPNSSIFKNEEVSLLNYSIHKKTDIVCQHFALEQKGMSLIINNENYTFNALGEDNIAAAMAGIGVGNLLGISNQIIKNGIENFVSPINTLGPIGGIAGVFLINDDSIYPEQIQKRINFLKNLTQKLIIIFNPDNEYYSENYLQIFSTLPRTSKIAICGGTKNDARFEELCKDLRKESIVADFYPVRRDTIKDIVTKTNFGEVIILMGAKGIDFDDFCNNIWITLGNKAI